MVDFKLDIDKTIQATLYVLKSLGGQGDFHKIFKILYFADRKHLARFGCPVIGDSYVAMKNGPVPSNLYDVLKSIRYQTIVSTVAKEFSSFFDVKDNFVAAAKKDPDMDYLSESDIECLDESILENKKLSFAVLSNKSHDDAWNKATENDDISILDIARAEGANQAMVDYILLTIENQQVLV